MRNYIVFFVFFLVILPLFGVHDFTINGETQLLVAISDSLHLEFEFESVGNSADFELAIIVLGQEIPFFSGNYLLFQDGGMLDSTGLDGTFAGGLNNFIQLPDGATLRITLTDEDVSDTVELQFVQLDTDFSISGNILQESGWMDLPVMGALVWTIYNGSAEYLAELFENFDLETFLEFISSDHYILSDITGFLGNYQIYIPQDIPDVPCTAGVYSAIDLNGEFIAPDPQEITVNGHVSGINFLYLYPDGEFYGVVFNSEGEPVSDAAFIIQNPNSVIPWLVTLDEMGNFSVAMANGTYTFTIAALGYQIYSDTFTIDNNDVYMEIELEDLIQEPDAQFYGYVLDEQNEPIINAEIMIIPISPSGEPQFLYTMADGSFGTALYNGTYSYMVSHAWFIGITGEFEIADEDIFMEIIMLPVNETDNNCLALSKLRAYPNPFNPETLISFYLPQDARVLLEVYNVRGQLIDTILKGNLAAGNHNLQWKPLHISSGTYFLCLQTGENVRQKKIILLK
jgi:hypothetical protein